MKRKAQNQPRLLPKTTYCTVKKIMNKYLKMRFLLSFLFLNLIKLIYDFILITFSVLLYSFFVFPSPSSSCWFSAPSFYISFPFDLSFFFLLSPFIHTFPHHILNVKRLKGNDTYYFLLLLILLIIINEKGMKRNH